MMENELKFKLLSYNFDNIEICVSATRISITKGNVVDIFKKAQENIKNNELVQKVLRSVHKSIIEHAAFIFVLKDLSVFVKQFFIECRLVSFTVKSRCYVDFSNFGYYIPPDLTGENLSEYCHYMDALFVACKVMLKSDIPKEDMRFLLLYSFKSNLYCTLDARELIHIISDIKYERNQRIPKLQDLADEVLKQPVSVFHCIHLETDVSVECDTVCMASKRVRVEECTEFIEPREAGKLTLLNKPSNSCTILDAVYRMNHSGVDDSLEIHMLTQSERPRKLEQLAYSFLVSNVTLSGITHIVRHRMQLIIIPFIQGIEHSKFILLDTIKRDEGLTELYKNALETSNILLKKFCENKELRRYSYYYALSRNLMDIMIKINARELKHFIRLRACNCAQWEIQNISIEMLKYLRKSFPELFCGFGLICSMLPENVRRAG